ncbi:hypothetical protein [Kitasatospora sp. NPDC056800]|uniref:hypothetical protein n=1 Tax=Kitasatospora sp. NPDC056800 TaxID=3345948 RepID=UPI0036C16A15
MSESIRPHTPVVHLDLRTAELAGTDPADLRNAVTARLPRPRPHDHRFLVVDTPAGLVGHRTRYEQLMGYPAPGRVRVLCLLVGDLTAHPPEGHPAERRLVRPDTLRGPEAGLIWAGDLHAGDGRPGAAAPDDPHALAVLVDLLGLPEVFDETLDVLGALPEGVAAPGLRVLEHGLAPEVRSQAWSEALLRFAGSRTAAPAGVAAHTGADLPPALSTLAVGAASGSPGRREEGGDAARAHDAAAEALADADAGLLAFGRPAGLLTGAGRAELESALGRARQALDRYHDVVGQVLRSDGGTAGAQPAAESAARLARLGVAVAPAATSGERIGDSLRSLALGLLRDGLPLRAVAQRFAQLAEQVQPLSNTPLLAALDGLRAGGPDGRRPEPDPPGAGVLALTALTGVLGGLWSGAALPAALTVPVLVLVGVLLVARRLPGGSARAVYASWFGAAALVGAAGGVAGAWLTGLPVWAAALALLLALGCWGRLLLGLWHGYAQRWGRERGVVPLRGELDGLDALLTRALREFWAVEERRYCADAALAVVGVLRTTADTAEEEAARGLAADRPEAAEGAESSEEGAELWLYESGEEGPEFDEPSWTEDYDWNLEPPRSAGEFGAAGDGGSDFGADFGADGSGAGADPGPTAVVPPWLERGEAKGGPDLVTVLTGDLTDAALTALEPYWGAVERGHVGDAAQERIAQRVRELLGVARDHLRHNDVLSAPPFASPHRDRGGPVGLLGIDARRAADSTALDPDGHTVVQLNASEQLDLLSRDPSAVALIRFGPEAARDTVGPDTPYGDGYFGGAPGPRGEREVLTAAGRYAGLLRLTGLKPGVVRTVRQWHDEAPESEEYEW